MNQKLLKRFKQVSEEYIKKNETIRNAGTTSELLKYALKIGCEIYQVFPKKLIFILKKGKKTLWLNMAMSSLANPVGIVITKNKNLTKKLLRDMNYPVPNDIIVSNLIELKRIQRNIKLPVVVKPLSAAGGKGVTVNIRNKDLLVSSFLVAKKYSKKVIIEQHFRGDYYRLTYIADGSFAATKNLPAYITGDGKNSARQLIKAENKRRDELKNKKLKKIRITEKTKRLLASEGYKLSSIIPKGRKVPLCFSGYDGGEYIDVTDKVHPYFRKLAANIANFLELPVIGIDIITTDISRPLEKTGGAIIEVNGKYPDIQFHSTPTQGKPRHLASNIINYLFRKV